MRVAMLTLFGLLFSSGIIASTGSSNVGYVHVCTNDKTLGELESFALRKRVKEALSDFPGAKLGSIVVQESAIAQSKPCIKTRVALSSCDTFFLFSSDSGVFETTLRAMVNLEDLEIRREWSRLGLKCPNKYLNGNAANDASKKTMPSFFAQTSDPVEAEILLSTEEISRRLKERESYAQGKYKPKIPKGVKHQTKILAAHSSVVSNSKDNWRTTTGFNRGRMIDIESKPMPKPKPTPLPIIIEEEEEEDFDDEPEPTPPPATPAPPDPTSTPTPPPTKDPEDDPEGGGGGEDDDEADEEEEEDDDDESEEAPDVPDSEIDAAVSAKLSYAFGRMEAKEADFDGRGEQNSWYFWYRRQRTCSTGKGRCASKPSASPTMSPTDLPTASPTSFPTFSPTPSPTDLPTASPTSFPSHSPTPSPTDLPTASPTSFPTFSPTPSPIASPTASPTSFPTLSPTPSPTTMSPTASPTPSPTGSPTPLPYSFGRFLSDVMGAACPVQPALVTKCMAKSDYEEVTKDVVELLNDQGRNCTIDSCPQARMAGCIVRTAGHDLMDYNPADGTGGSDGCIAFGDPDNAGLRECLQRKSANGLSVRSVYAKHCGYLSLADFLVIAAEAVMSEKSTTGHMDFKSQFKFGRSTARTCAPEALPNPEDGCDAVEKNYIDALGLDIYEAVALMGVHTIGRADLKNSGYDGWWSDPLQQNTFNNDYFKSLALKGWVPQRAVGGDANKNQWQRSDAGRQGPSEMMLNTDLCLLYHDSSSSSGVPVNAKTDMCCAWATMHAFQKPLTFHTLSLDHMGKKGTPVPAITNGELLCGTSIEMNPGTDLCCSHGEGGSITDSCGNINNPDADGFEAVRAYAANETYFLRDFISVWKRVTENGVGKKSL